jgi:signal transduction histidine kinase
MVKIRLRTKFLFSLIFTTAALTGASLLIVQKYLGKHARREIYEQLNSSLLTFQQFAQQRQRVLAQSAEIAANLPNIKALMTTQDERTIQDASADFLQMAASDLFLLANPAGKVMALHTSTGAFDRQIAQASLAQTLARGQPRDWWFGGGHLYEVFLQPIYFGAPQENVLLGVLATGFEIDERLAGVVARISSSRVAFCYGKTVVISTLLPNQQTELAAGQNLFAAGSSLKTAEVRLGDENFVGTSVELAPTASQPVTLTVLKSYDAAILFLQNLNRLLLVVGLIAVISGSGLIFLISDTFTRPLAKLVSGVHALEKGDFAYPLNVESHDELGEVTIAFERMRKTLQESQQHLLHAERLATIGRMASSISHDLRHPLTTILAYAEILSESDLSEDQRKELYQEIRLSVQKMTELIASLLEFSKAQEALQLTYGDVLETVQHAIGTVRLRPEFRKIQITLNHEGSTESWFDAQKLDRAFHNILQNACEAVPADSARVQVTTRRVDNHVEVSVTDNGPGIPEEVRETVFEPFVTYGKEAGTGLGLAIVHKVVRDHGGDVKIESTGRDGTTVKLSLPVTPPERVSPLGT